MRAIKKLIHIMDSDLSNRVDIEEIIYFVYKHGLQHDIPPELGKIGVGGCLV